MENYFFPGKNKKSYINKISRLFFFATWLTKFFILILHYPKVSTDGDLGAGLYFLAFGISIFNNYYTFRNNFF